MSALPARQSRETDRRTVQAAGRQIVEIDATHDDLGGPALV
jgi:hypothetical protein